MSSTNKTTYYELPQYVGNDVFNPLVDDNDAYSKIDTALHNIADAEADDASEIVSIKSRLDSAEGDIDTLEAQNGNAVLTTVAQTLSEAINELDADTSALDSRLDIVEDDLNNVSTGIKQKISALETDVNTLETQNGTAVLTTTAQTLSEAINELDGVDASLAEDISDINSAISNIISENSLRNAHILTIGDSYDRTANFTQSMSNFLGHGNLSDTLDTNCFASVDHYIIECARGGSGFTNNGGGASSGNGFLDRLTEAKEALTASECNDIDYIVVTGCVNDCFYLSSDPDWNLLHNNMVAFKTYAHHYFPNAKILVFFIGNVISADNPSGITPEKVEVGAYHYQSECGVNGFGYITNAEFVLRATPDVMSSDNLHPATNVGNYIASYLVSGIITGSVDVSWIPTLHYNFTKDPDGPWNFALTCWITKNMKNNVTYMHINAFDATFTPDYTFAFNTYVKVATQTGMYAKQDIIRHFMGMIQVGTDWKLVNVAIKFSGYDVSIAFCGSVDGRTSITAKAFTTCQPLDFVINSYEI